MAKKKLALSVVRSTVGLTQQANWRYTHRSEQRRFLEATLNKSARACGFIRL
jgi:hypothetical protein